MSQNLRKIYTVSELTSEIKSLLEENFPFVWISGEISNLSTPVSGHYYFTLKDENAHIRAVMFRGQNRKLKFMFEDGLSIIGLGRINLYAPRGTYQIIFEYIEPKGIGALQLAFEKLKIRLSEEGLFDDKYKTPLPFLPNKISVITSPTGAVIHDIIDIINRRFYNIPIEIIPVKVQGDGSILEIVSAFDIVNKLAESDGSAEVVILARGGGSIEDLAAFNSEEVAKAIFTSKIPVVSAIGHETDYTISDFVADLRAPTPSVAAELVVPLKNELKNRCDEMFKNLISRIYNNIERLNSILKEMNTRLVDPGKNIQDFILRIDDCINRLIKSIYNVINKWRDQLMWMTKSLYANSPYKHINNLGVTLKRLNHNLLSSIDIYIQNKHSITIVLASRLNDLSPVAILDRGYSITRTIPDAVVVRDPKTVNPGQELEVRLSKGSLICRVEGKSENGQDKF
ncbi:MAG: exodeoxyribonuclease VII large subunit [Desulfobacterales bacterium]|nr:exodeoxyribonuclease VII large subunit [Desulfobacterales bacterium]